jgi:hypothetical protein
LVLNPCRGYSEIRRKLLFFTKLLLQKRTLRFALTVTFREVETGRALFISHHRFDDALPTASRRHSRQTCLRYVWRPTPGQTRAAILEGIVFYSTEKIEEPERLA